MARLLFPLICIIFFITAKGQSSYAEAIKQGDDAFEKKEYKIAINKYFAAEAFDPSKKVIVKEKVNKVFDAIEALRKKAEEDKILAQKAEKKAQANYLISEAKSVLPHNPTLSLRLAEQAMQYDNTKSIEQTALNIYMDKSNVFYKIAGTVSPRQNSLQSCIVSSDKKSFLFRNSSGIHIIDLTTKEEKSITNISSDAVVVFSDNGNFLVTKKLETGYTNSIFDIEYRKLGEFITNTNYLIQFSLNGNHLIAYNNNGQFKFLDFNGNVKKVVTLENINDCNFAVSDNENLIFTFRIVKSIVTPGKIDVDYNVLLWNDQGKIISDLNNKITKPFNSALFLPYGGILLTNEDNTVTWIDHYGNKIGHLSGNSGNVLSVNFSKDRKQILTYASDHTIREWEIRNEGKYTNTLGWVDWPQIKFSSQGEYYFVKGYNDNVFKIQPGYDGKEINNDRSDDVQEPANIANNEMINFISPDLTLNDPHPDFIKSNKRIKAYCYLPDKKSVLIGISNETIKNCDHNGQLIRDYKIPWEKEMTTIGLSPDKKIVITGYSDGSVIIWNSNAVKLYSLKCHSQFVRAIIFSPDGKYFMTMGDTQAKLYQVQTGLAIYEYDEVYHPDMAWYAPNGKYILIKLNEGGRILPIPIALNEFLKSNKIETLSAEQKKEYGIK